jgi:hypothetical protein
MGSTGQVPKRNGQAQAFVLIELLGKLRGNNRPDR